jgi:hypothetical protein
MGRHGITQVARGNPINPWGIKWKTWYVTACNPTNIPVAVLQRWSMVAHCRNKFIGPLKIYLRLADAYIGRWVASSGAGEASARLHALNRACAR